MPTVSFMQKKCWVIIHPDFSRISDSWLGGGTTRRGWGGWVTAPALPPSVDMKGRSVFSLLDELALMKSTWWVLIIGSPRHRFLFALGEVKGFGPVEKHLRCRPRRKILLSLGCLWNGSPTAGTTSSLKHQFSFIWVREAPRVRRHWLPEVAGGLIYFGCGFCSVCYTSHSRYWSGKKGVFHSCAAEAARPGFLPGSFSVSL